MWKIDEVQVYAEPCDCGTQNRHNNGGNYHHRTNVVTVRGPEAFCVIVEDTDTREVFPREEHDALLYVDGKFELVYDWNVAAITLFRVGQARIVHQEKL
jgi:hypothetical protein